MLGRGNQQISPRVIRKVGKEQIEIVATKEKLAGLGGQPMHVDTGDADADEYLKGIIKLYSKILILLFTRLDKERICK